MVKNLPCNAEDTGSIPGQGTRIPRAHVPQPLSQHTTTRESVCRNGRSGMMQQRSPCMPQLRPDTAEQILKGKNKRRRNLCEGGGATSLCDPFRGHVSHVVRLWRVGEGPET